MVLQNSKERYFCILKVFSFSIRLVSNSRPFLDEFKQLASGFELIESECQVTVEYEVFVSHETEGIHFLTRDGEVVYKTVDYADLLLALQEYFLEDFISSTDGYYLLHSAILVKNSRAVLLPADSKSGKSTLSIALIKDEFDYLSDEVAAVDLDTLKVGGFPRAIAIREETLSLFPSLEPEIEHRMYKISGNQQDLTIHYGIPSRNRPASKDKFFPLSAIVFPEYSPKRPTRLRELNSSLAVFCLMQCSLNQLRLGGKGFETASRLVREVPCYSLEMNNVSKVSEVISKLISD